MATGLLFGKIGANILGGETGAETKALDWISDTSKCSLHTAATSFNVDTDEIFSDVADEVAAGGGYSSGGYTLSGQTVTYNATGNITVLDCGDPTWTATGSGFAASHAVFTGDTAGDSLLIQYLAFDAGTITLASGDTLTINIDATNGLWYVTAT